MAVTADNGKAALVIAHPGHELCVHGWLEKARPRVFVLTDGSGRSGVSRLSSTSRILSDAGASVGSIYGRFTDLSLYAAILDGDFGLFEQIVTELAEALVRENVAYVAGDAMEGYNPIHDVCRVMINAAVELASRASLRAIINRDSFRKDTRTRPTLIGSAATSGRLTSDGMKCLIARHSVRCYKKATSVKLHYALSRLSREQTYFFLSRRWLYAML